MSTEPIFTKKCIACERVKEIKHFYKNVNTKDGRESRCKICKSRGITKQPHKHIQTKKENWSDSLSLNGCKDEDYCKAYQLLRSMGYSVEGDVHLQFCEKYGLEPKKREKRDENKIKYFQCF